MSSIVESSPNVDWMLPEEAFGWITTNIGAGEIIVEFGSGHGSIELSKHYTLTSVEHNKNWLNISQGNYIFSEITPNPISTKSGQLGWYQIDILKQNLPPKPCLIIIDGPPGSIGRHGVLNLIDYLSTAKFILVDDIDREAESDLLESIHSQLKCQISTNTSSKLRANGSVRKFAILKMEGLV
jgi:hypothetical protein|tara:strand:- start:5073 stop:5621 length:549 start_codon:yes stop_codon:yes gene_type:complete